MSPIVVDTRVFILAPARGRSDMLDDRCRGTHLAAVAQTGENACPRTRRVARANRPPGTSRCVAMVLERPRSVLAGHDLRATHRADAWTGVVGARRQVLVREPHAGSAGVERPVRHPRLAEGETANVGSPQPSHPARAMRRAFLQPERDGPRTSGGCSTDCAVLRGPRETGRNPGEAADEAAKASGVIDVKWRGGRDSTPRPPA